MRLRNLLWATLFAPLMASANGIDTSQPIRLVVGYAAGGSVDAVARKYAQRLTELLGQTVVVENKGGASGVVAALAVKSAQPNGNTIYFVASPTICMTPALTKTSFDPVADFTPVGSVVKYTNVLLVNHSSPFKNVNDLVEFGRKTPGAVTYGSAGNGSSNHLSGALLAKFSNVEMTHVPFKGNAPAVSELMAGRITLVFDANTQAISQINAGTVRALAVTSAKRNKMLPNVPTLAESGFKDFKVENWIGLLLPARATTVVVKRLADANNRILADSSFVKDMEQFGYEIDSVSPDQLANRIKSDYAFYKNIAPTIKMD